jgi:hypothetical protein
MLSDASLVLLDSFIRTWYIRFDIYGLPFVGQAITAPTTALNAITIAAFRKYVLVSLIQNGQVCNQSREPGPFI